MRFNTPVSDLATPCSIRRAGTGHIVKRNGLTLTEVIIACMLLSTVMLVFVPTVAGNRHVHQELRRYRLGLDELSNQMERLTQLPADDLATAIADLRPSELATASLPAPELVGELEDSETEGGTRLTLRLSWQSRPRRPVPLAMTTWLYQSADADQPVAESDASQPEEN